LIWKDKERVERWKAAYKNCVTGDFALAALQSLLLLDVLLAQRSIDKDSLKRQWSFMPGRDFNRAAFFSDVDNALMCELHPLCSGFPVRITILALPILDSGPQITFGYVSLSSALLSMDA
jgi:hypothetical protein